VALSLQMLLCGACLCCTHASATWRPLLAGRQRGLHVPPLQQQSGGHLIRWVGGVGS